MAPKKPSLKTCKTTQLPWWIIVLTVILIIAILYLIYVTFFKYDVILVQKSSDVENFSTSGQNWDLIFLTMNGCTWCEKMRPSFEQMVTTYARALKQMGVTAMEIESSDPRAQKYAKWVEGYPTLILVSKEKPDLVRTFEGERSPEQMMKFVKTYALGDFFTMEKYTEEDDDDAIETNMTDMKNKTQEANAAGKEIEENQSKTMQESAGAKLGPQPSDDVTEGFAPW